MLGDIFLQLLRKGSSGLESYRGDSTLATWLRKVVSSRTINHLRSLKNPPRYIENLPAAGAANPASDKEMRGIVNRCLARLSNKERLVVKLFYFEQKKYREIAEILDIPAGSIGPTLTRALFALREFMRE